MFCTLKSIFFESNEHKTRFQPGQTSNGYKSLLIFFLWLRSEFAPIRNKFAPGHVKKGHIIFKLLFCLKKIKQFN